MEDRTRELLEAALKYAARGWHVFPLHNPTESGCSCGNKDCSSVGKHPRTKNGVLEASTDEPTIRQWWLRWPTANIGIRTGLESQLFVLDVDARHGGDDSLLSLRESFGALPQTICAVTGGGEHYYFAHPGRPVQNSSGRIADGLDIRGEGGYVVAPPSLHPSGRLYLWEGSGDPDEVALAQAPPWVLQHVRMPVARVSGAPNDDEMKIPSGGRNNILASMAGTMRRRGFPETSILAALLDLNDRRCDPPLDPVEVRKIAWSVSRYQPSASIIEAAQSAPAEDVAAVDNWPVLPGNALRGLAGEVVRTLDPYTEADPAAVLLHFMTFFGNCVGTGPHFRIGGDEHTAKLFGVVVGDSATGRKGTSEGDIRRIFENVDLDWTKRRLIHGLASGEGLIRALMPNGTSADPRLMAIEREFGNVLAAMGRQGSILSGILRKAWDSGDLQHQTRKDPIVVHGVHVSLIAHITLSELLRTMDASESFNGFANRFLWILVRRSKSLPDAPQVPDRLFQALSRNVSEAIDFARRTSEMRRNTDAAILWRQLYEEFQKPRPGILGALCARGHVQVLRLSVIYALLDLSAEVAPWHIEAAKAFWDFSVECSSRIFGGKMGDPIAQRMLEELLEAEGGTLTRSELWEALGRNIQVPLFENSLNLLVESGYVRRHRKDNKPGEKGRRTEFIELIKAAS